MGVGTAGIGREFLLAIAKHNPAHLFFTGRNAASGEATIAQVKDKAPSTPITFLQCDLGSVESVRAAAEQFLASTQRLDVLVPNAGIMAVPPGKTSDGHEIQFGVNFVGHAALIQLLLPTMLRTAALPGADVRLLMATSQGHQLHPRAGIKFETLHTAQEDTNRWVKYGQAKLAAILWTQEMARRHPSIRSVSVHPGVIRTGLIDNLDATGRLIAYYFSMVMGKVITQEQGPFNLLWAATAEREQVEGGGYYEPVGEKVTPMRLGGDEELAGRLWEWTGWELERLGITGD